MRKSMLLFLVMLNFASAIGQTYSTVTSDEEIYDFLNWMTIHSKKYGEEPKLKRKHIHQRILSWDTINFITNDSPSLNDQFSSLDMRYLYQRRSGMDSIFTQQDRDFLFKQFKAIKDTIWHKSFSNSKLLSNKKQKRPNNYYYSIPLFSVDKNYVIIHRQFYCGSSCAYGGYYLYRRLDKDHWIFVTALNTWIS